MLKKSFWEGIWGFRFRGNGTQTRGNGEIATLDPRP